MNPSRAFIPLILCTLALSIAAVALIVNGALKLPGVDAIGAACAEQFLQNQEPSSCPAPTMNSSDSLTITVPPSTMYPGFTYPLGFNAIAEESATGTTVTLTGSGLFFSSCLQDCTNAVVAIISTAPFALAGTETLDGFVQSAYADDSSAVIQKSVFGNGTKYTIIGNSLEDPLGSYTHIRFFGATTEAFVLLHESDLLPVGTAERDALLSSFDFSLIP